ILLIQIHHGRPPSLNRHELHALSGSSSLDLNSMDIHRSRFVPYPPAAITTLAFSHVTSTNRGLGNDVRLAVGRANGDIEIWNPLRGDWVQENIFRGGRSRTVDGLAWIQEPDETVAGKVIEGRLRLFSIGYSHSITEWDLHSGVPLRDASGGGSAIWCMASQPRMNKTTVRKEGPDQDQDQNQPFRGQNLVAGCADGSLILFSTADDDLRFARYITRAPTKKAQALCITFQDRNKIVAGYANSFMRVYDIRNGRLIRNITLGAGLPGGPKETLVWQVKCLTGGDIVSGNSNGEIQIWDGKTYSQRQRIVGHKSDILALATASDGKTIFSGGTDMRTVIYKQDTQNRWTRAYNEKIHEHEVKAFATFQDRKIDVVVSGGIDASPIVMPIKHFGSENRRTLPRLPQHSPVMSAPSQRLLATWWNRDVLIWRVGSGQSHERPTKNWKLISRLVMKSEENISSASLSSDGRILAVSTVAEVKLFHLYPAAGGSRFLRVRKIRVPERLQKGARLVQFSPNGNWVAVVSNASDVTVARIILEGSGSDEVVTILSEIVPLRRTLKSLQTQDGLNGTWGSYNRTLNRLAFSSDSSVLVVNDLGGSFDSWILEGHEDLTAASIDKVTSNGASHSTSPSDSGSDNESDGDEDPHPIVIYGQHWTRNPNNRLLPALDSVPLVLSFRPSTQPIRVLTNGNPAVHPTRHNPHAHSNQKPSGEHLFEFDVLKGQLTDWSRRNPTASFPVRWRSVMDRTIGCVWDISSEPRRERLWMYGNNFDSPPKDSGGFDSESQTVVASGRAEDILLEKRSGGGGPVRDKDRENVGDASEGPPNSKLKRAELEDIDEDEGIELPRVQRPGNGDVDTNGLLVKTDQAFKYRSILGPPEVVFAGPHDRD
ncbi:WD40 repeat-like protein, partial [Viridothelium virens]